MKFGSMHIQDLIGTVLEDIKNVQHAADTGHGDWNEGGVVDMKLYGSINKLRHAAEELEAERLESIYGIKQI